MTNEDKLKKIVKYLLLISIIIDIIYLMSIIQLAVILVYGVAFISWVLVIGTFIAYIMDRYVGNLLYKHLADLKL